MTVGDLRRALAEYPDHRPVDLALAVPGHPVDRERVPLVEVSEVQMGTAPGSALRWVEPVVVLS